MIYNINNIIFQAHIINLGGCKLYILSGSSWRASEKKHKDSENCEDGTTTCVQLNSSLVVLVAFFFFTYVQT